MRTQRRAWALGLVLLLACDGTTWASVGASGSAPLALWLSTAGQADEDDPPAELEGDPGEELEESADEWGEDETADDQGAEDPEAYESVDPAGDEGDAFDDSAAEESEDADADDWAASEGGDEGADESLEEPEADAEAEAAFEDDQNTTNASEGPDADADADQALTADESAETALDGSTATAPATSANSSAPPATPPTPPAPPAPDQTNTEKVTWEGDKTYYEPKAYPVTTLCTAENQGGGRFGNPACASNRNEGIPLGAGPAYRCEKENGVGNCVVDRTTGQERYLEQCRAGFRQMVCNSTVICKTLTNFGFDPNCPRAGRDSE